MEDASQFPRRVVLGTGNGMQSSIAWLVEEVLSWEDTRISERGAVKPSRPSVLQRAGAAP
jgi:predicted DNA-binding transcriptional regulator AlpA